MKRALLTLLALMLAMAPALADRQRVRSLQIYVDLEKDGTATVYERWDVSTGDKITEWYLVRENLGDITVDGLYVRADDKPLKDDGEWDVDRSLEEKAGKSGIVHKKNGVELCWGIGSVGDHVYDVLYQMHGAVKSLNDYDMLHLQLVSPGLSSPPEEVVVCIGTELVQLDTTNTRIWGFGYEGTCVFEDGGVVMQGDGAFDQEESVIALLRFKKGIFEPTSEQDKDFQQVLDVAMVGASFKDDDKKEDGESKAGVIIVTLIIGAIFWWRTRRIKNADRNVGTPLAKFKKENAAWYRDIPMEGNLPAAKYLLSLAHDDDVSLKTLTSALILRMVYNGYLEVSRKAEGVGTEIRFTGKDTADLDVVSKGLYVLLKSAAGENGILEKKEFSSWNKENQEEVYLWGGGTDKMSQPFLKENGYVSGYSTMTESGAAEVKKLWGLRKFLLEFTLTGQREAFEAHLWKEYMVYGALLGIAREVAKQFKDIAPEMYKQIPVTDTMDLSYAFALILSDTHDKYDAYLRYTTGGSSHGSSSGYGGRSSRGGGGGFSGGGRGGGGR